MNYSMLDLGAGLGGGSESMLNNGWDVQRVDKNPLLSAVPNMTIRNINQLADELEKLKVLLDDGAIDSDEFITAKKKILSSKD